MGFEDFLEKSRGHHNSNHGHGYHDDHRYKRYSHESDEFSDSHRHFNRYDGHLNWVSLLEKIKTNRKFKTLLIIAGVFILLLVISVLLVLLPLIIKLINYISQSGLQGIFDNITGFIDKIWKGTGN